jgi:hypothetical protein
MFARPARAVNCQDFDAVEHDDAGCRRLHPPRQCLPSLALTVGALELLALLDLVDYRLVLGIPITEPWRHPRNRRGGLAAGC